MCVVTVAFCWNYDEIILLLLSGKPFKETDKFCHKCLTTRNKTAQGLMYRSADQYG